MTEYQETKNDPVHEEAKKQFDYLHKKLGHIKRLVDQFDQNLVENNVPTANDPNDCSNEIKDIDSRHY